MPRPSRRTPRAPSLPQEAFESRIETSALINALDWKALTEVPAGGGAGILATMKFAQLMVLICLAGGVLGCGQKGPLVMPDAQKHKRTVPTPPGTQTKPVSGSGATAPAPEGAGSAASPAPPAPAIPTTPSTPPSANLTHP